MIGGYFTICQGAVVYVGNCIESAQMYSSCLFSRAMAGKLSGAMFVALLSLLPTVLGTRSKSLLPSDAGHDRT